MGMTEEERLGLKELSLKRVKSSGIDPSAKFEGKLHPDIEKKIQEMQGMKT